MSMQDINKTALKYIEQNCLLRDKTGGYSENAEGFFRRVSSAVASADARYDSEADTAETADGFFELLTSLRFVPGSLTLINAGRHGGQLASCFVLPIEDSMESIFEAVKNAALIYKSGGNIGFSFTQLRKSGSAVHGINGAAGGPVGFMRVFGAVAEAVRQEKKPHGENLAVLRIDHPDIESFIHCHENVPELANFHTAVIITDKFLQAAEKGKNFSLIDPTTHKKAGSIKANEMFVRLVDTMRRTGAPLALFEKALGDAAAVAPCGEQPLMPYECCNIGSINLTKMLKSEDGVFAIDYDTLRTTVIEAVHFLDNVIDVNSYPFEKISHVTRQTRKIALGVTGFADMLWHLGIPYNSQDAVELAESLMAFINAESHAASFDLAEKRGAYPTHAEDADTPLAMRNKAVTAIAPEDFLFELCGCAVGIAPREDVLENGRLHPLLIQKLVDAQVYSTALEQQIVLNNGLLTGIDSVPDDIKDVFTCADTASPAAQAKLQAAFQKNTDGAVSQNIVFNQSATAVNYADAFLRAHDDGCMMFKPKRFEPAAEKTAEVPRRLQQVSGEVRAVPDVVNGTTERFRTPCGALSVTVSYDAEGVCEVYTAGPENCGCAAFAKAAQRLADLSLRSGIPAENVCTQMRGIKCPSAQLSLSMRGVSCPDAISSVIERAAALSRNMRPDYLDNKYSQFMSSLDAQNDEKDEDEIEVTSKAVDISSTADIDIDDDIDDAPEAEIAEAEKAPKPVSELTPELSEKILQEAAAIEGAILGGDAALDNLQPIGSIASAVAFEPARISQYDASILPSEYADDLLPLDDGLAAQSEVFGAQEIEADTDETLADDAFAAYDIEAAQVDMLPIEEAAAVTAAQPPFEDDLLGADLFEKPDHSKLAQSIFASFAGLDDDLSAEISADTSQPEAEISEAAEIKKSPAAENEAEQTEPALDEDESEDGDDYDVSLADAIGTATQLDFGFDDVQLTLDDDSSGREADNAAFELKPLDAEDLSAFEDDTETLTAADETATADEPKAKKAPLTAEEIGMALEAGQIDETLDIEAPLEPAARGDADIIDIEETDAPPEADAAEIDTDSLEEIAEIDDIAEIDEIDDIGDIDDPDDEPVDDDENTAEPPMPDYLTEQICAVCGSKADIVGEKIICPVCGFTRTRK